MTIERVLRKTETAKALGVSVTTLWRMAGLDPAFPKARVIGRGGLVGYLESEVTNYLRSRPEVDPSAGRERTAAALRARGIAKGVPNAR